MNASSVASQKLEGVGSIKPLGGSGHAARQHNPVDCGVVVLPADKPRVRQGQGGLLSIAKCELRHIVGEEHLRLRAGN
jgi:hypothetical protein